MVTTYEPTGGRLLVKKRQLSGGKTQPENGHDACYEATVEAIGPQIRDQTLKANVIVVIKTGVGIEVDSVAGLMLIRESDILAKKTE